MRSSNIVVIGGSAGSIPVLRHIVSRMPPAFPAPVLIVLHLPPEHPTALARILNREGGPSASVATHGEKLAASRIYVGSPDHHLIVSDGALRLTRGPRENRSRPSIDPLFRSAARSYSQGAIAVLLSGFLDDGVQGLVVVSRLGGTVIVLKPEDAPVPDMAQNAIKYDHPDYVLDRTEIAEKLQELVVRPVEGGHMTVQDESYEAKRAASGFICPDCGGALYEDGTESLPHFQCRVGHSYSVNALLTEKNDRLESALWAAVRSLKENAELKQRTAATLERAGSKIHAARLREDAEVQLQQAKLLRERLIEGTDGSS